MTEGPAVLTFDDFFVYLIIVGHGLLLATNSLILLIIHYILMFIYILLVFLMMIIIDSLATIDSLLMSHRSIPSETSLTLREARLDSSLLLVKTHSRLGSFTYSIIIFIATQGS